MKNPFLRFRNEPPAAAQPAQPVVVVSGLPRSGTSMMMKMVDAGGIPPLTDELRAADEDNPKGYYEFERVKDLEKEKDKTWVRDARGKVLKVISFLIKDLPDDNAYRVVFMRRDLGEVLASQNKMLAHRGEANSTSDDTMTEAYLNHLASVRILARKRPNMEMMEIRYDQTFSSPRETAARVNQFLGGTLDETRMTEAVDSELYRNRRKP